MGNGAPAIAGYSELAVTNLRTLVDKQERDYAWLSRTSGVPYKRLLAQVKHGTQALDLDVAIAAALALGSDLPAILGSAD